MSDFRVLCVFGTRPEAIKMAPLVLKLKAAPGVKCGVCVTGQHRHLLDQVLDVFGIKPEYDLDLMTHDQTPGSVASAVLSRITGVFDDFSPAIVLIHGDTTTTLAAGLGAFYANIPVAHVEAGLRTGNIRAPWPEEMNRSVVAKLCSLHFAPTKGAYDNLLSEGVSPERICVTGNTIVDAALLAREKIDSDSNLRKTLSASFQMPTSGKKIVLVTGHRRENIGQPFRSVCKAIKRISDRKDIHVIFSVHPNPNVQKPVEELLGNVKNVTLIKPPGYLAFVFLLRKADLVISDSGGIQEEAVVFKKHVLVTREMTERPEGVATGLIKVVGEDEQVIVNTALQIMNHKSVVKYSDDVSTIYGDGTASERIVDALLEYRQASRVAV